MLTPRRRSALLVDFENMYKRCGAEKFVERIDSWMAWLEDGQFDPERVRRDFVVKRVFWNSQDDIHRLEFTRRSFEAQICRAIRKEKASSADFDMTIHATELPFVRRSLQEIVILSLDTDFATVIHYLQKRNVLGVAGIDPEAKFADKFRNIVDVGIEKDDFVASYAYERPKRTLFGKRDAAAAPEPVRERAPIIKPRKTDVAGAAKHLASVGAAMPNKALGKAFVERTLAQAVEGFSKTSTKASPAWLGCGTYEAMLRHMAQYEPALHVWRTNDGGVHVKFVTGAAGASAAPA